MIDEPTLMPAPDGARADPVIRADSVAQAIRDSASHTEQLGTMAPEAVAALRDAGLFWLIVPTTCGGMGADVIEMLGVVERVSRADGSTGWSLMTNSLITGLAAAFCSATPVPSGGACEISAALPSTSTSTP